MPCTAYGDRVEALQRPVDGDGGIIELSHAHTFEVMASVFSFAVTYPDDTANIVAEASRFAREQVALYGMCAWVEACVPVMNHAAACRVARQHLQARAKFSFAPKRATCCALPKHKQGSRPRMHR